MAARVSERPRYFRRIDSSGKYLKLGRFVVRARVELDKALGIHRVVLPVRMGTIGGGEEEGAIEVGQSMGNDSASAVGYQGKK